MNSRFKIIITILVVFLTIQSIYSQNIDSLKLNLSLTTSEYHQADILIQIAEIEFNNKNYTEAQKKANLALEIANLNDYDLYKAKAYHILGKIHFLRNNIESSIEKYVRSANAYESIKNWSKLIEINSETAEIYKSLGADQKAAEYYLVAYQIADSLGNEKEIKSFLEKTAEAYFFAKDFKNSEKYYLQLYNQYHVNNEINTYEKIRVLYFIAETYKQQSDFQKALLYSEDIYKLYLELADTNALSIVSNNIAYIYLNLKDYRSALSYFKDALKFGKETNLQNKELARIYSNLAICYQNLEDIDNTLINLKLAIKALKDTEEYYELGRLQNITANIYHSDKDNYNAEFFSRSSIESARKSGNKDLLQICYRTYSEILRDGNDYVSALEYYEKHLKLKDSLLFEKQIEEQKLNQRIVNLEKSEKELKLKLADEEVKDLALKQLRLEAEKRDKELALLKSEKELEQSERDRLQQSLRIAQQQHDAEIREQELKQLEQERAIQDLVLKQKEAEEKERQREIELLESEKEKQRLELEKEAEAKKRAQWMFALSGVIIVLVMVGFFVTRKKNAILAKQKIEIEYKNRDLEQKNEEIITQSERIIQQKDLIEKKNEEITDSILYASRIQEAVLPSIGVMDSYLSESFIFFKPKDIVSGDFYWAAESDEKLIVTAVDCTGHGVPGAFMSMLGMSFLNEIVLKENIVEADEILNQLRAEVIKSLKQTGRENEAKDGMDMALCVIDKKNMKMQFAGANNPMYFVRNGELEKIKSDRMPIGYHFRIGNDFTKQEIDLLKGDVIYIFSDGFADQFGGKDGRKLKYQPFQDLLLEIHQKSLIDQKDHLDKFFSNWRGSYEQIDDVLVIGMKI